MSRETKYIISVLLLLPLFSIGQGFKIKKEAIPLGLMFMSGIADGFVETVSHNYSGFKKAFPNANDNYWSPSISFTRKYKNNDPKQGERFPMSTNVLVFTTDFYHLGRFSEHLFTAGAIAFKIGDKRKKWYGYLVDIASYWASNRIGFALTYGYFKSLN